MDYYKKNQAKVVLAKILRGAGFELNGYKEDTSDAMTDYFNPAHWDGVATKGKYIAVADHKGENGLEILLNKDEYHSYCSSVAGLTTAQLEKIEKLTRLATNVAASIGEKENALSKIEGIKNKTSDITEVVAKYKTLNFPKTNFMFFIYDTDQNCIVYKETGLTKYSVCEYSFNIDKATIISRTYRKYDDNKLVNDLDDSEIESLQIALDSFNNLDNISFGYYQTEHKKDTEFSYVEIESKEIKENIYLMGYKNQPMKFFKEGYSGLKFKDVLKSGEMVKGNYYKILPENEVKNTQFYKQVTVPKKIWTKSKRGILLENKNDVVKENKNYTINKNEDKNGFEVKFDKKPISQVLTDLKVAGFRWSGYNKFWYIKQNKITVQDIKKILDI